METTTTSVQKIWIFHCRGGGFLIAGFCVYGTEKCIFLLRRFGPFSGIALLPLSNFQTTKFLNCADVSSTPNLQTGEPHTKCRTETVWSFAQNLSSIGAPTGIYHAASTAFGVHLRHANAPQSTLTLWRRSFFLNFSTLCI
jgi:hypothetical protein